MYRWACAGLVLVPLASAAVGNGAAACNLLSQSSISEQILYSNESGYASSLASYYSKQEEDIQPGCIVQPRTAAQVAQALQVLQGCSEDLTIAVKSGGHTPWAGSANVADGVTIDLQLLNSSTVRSDRQSISIGTGLRWGEVSSILDAEGLATSGGRVADVGVGGLTLGGGLSFFAPRYGFVCDNVINFEVVLANSSIVNASETSNADLWKALKGGSNNFGIVTKFELRSFDSGDLWGGSNYYNISTADQHLDAIYNFTEYGTDPYATVIQTFGFTAAETVIVESLQYTKPVENPPAFAQFLDIPVLRSGEGIANLTTVTEEEGSFSPRGRRAQYFTTTFRNDRTMLGETVSLWNATVPTVQQVANVTWSLTYEPLTTSITNHSASTGGNVLGLDGQPALMLVLLSAIWDNAQDDELLVSTALKLFDDIDASSKSSGLYSPFKYLNYAYSTQDPLGGYGEANLEFLKNVSQAYDPAGFFQNTVKGGFKLS